MTLLDSLPLEAHPWGPADTGVAMGSIYLVILALVTPPTAGWKLVRAGVVTPIACAGFLYFAHFSLKKCWEEHGGSATLFLFFCGRAFELLVFFPAEEYNHRIDRRAPTHLTLPAIDHDGHRSNGGQTSVKEELVLEPVPAPWTLSKFWWASSLFWSLRGLGWSWAAPLPESSQQHPFTRRASRKQFVFYQIRRYILGWILQDFVRACMNASEAGPFFSGRSGAPIYADLNQLQRAIYSTFLVLRVYLGTERSHIPAGVIMVCIGGAMGWEGEFWSPWGWPPLFGSLSDIWKYPGLAHMWSRTWQQYFRRWLFLFGWAGIGENILQLPHSGATAKEPTKPSVIATPLATPGATPTASGRTSPTHPLPTVPTRRSIPIPTYFSNLMKSLIVFTLTAWLHDQSNYFLLYHTQPDGNWKWTDSLVTTPFFVIQPLGLAAEAVFKRIWRGWKLRNHKEWAEGGGEPGWLVFVERLLGFAWTWIWLGWTAGWYLNIVRVGFYRRGDGQDEFPSLWGGLIWNKWKH